MLSVPQLGVGSNQAWAAISVCSLLGHTATSSLPKLGVHFFFSDLSLSSVSIAEGAVSVKAQTLANSPRETAVREIAASVMGTKYSKAGWPSLVMAFAAKATPKPRT